MSKDQVWIEAGYQLFAQEGPQAIRIERLARIVQKNKSSFYHFFSDAEVFTECLLTFHLIRAKVMSDKEAIAQSEEELIQVFLEHTQDLLFNRQLRIHRRRKDFQACFIKTNEESIPKVLPIWKKVIQLTENDHLAQMVLMLSMENFFLQLTEETLTSNWIASYFKRIRQMVQLFKRTSVTSPLDGSV